MIPWDRILEGLPATFIDGWHGNGGDLDVNAFVVHDTVTDIPEDQRYDERLLDYAARLARNGTDRVPPPVYHGLIGDNGEIVVMAAGRANHNGYGNYANDSAGWSFETRGGMAGNTEALTPESVEKMAVVARRVREFYGVPVLGHKETDPDRKRDPDDLDMNSFRSKLRSPDDDQEGDDVTLRRGDGMGDREHLRRDVAIRQMWVNLVRTGTSDASAGGLEPDGKFGEKTEKHVRDVEARFYGRPATTGKVDSLLDGWLSNAAHGVAYHDWTAARQGK